VTLGSTSHSRALIAATALVGLALCLHGGVGAADFLCLAPALALASMLFVRRYPGERALMRLAARSGPRRPPTTVSLPPAPRPAVRVPRGGLLMAFALAVRPPPRALLTS
jgi:hypothetical protein